VRLVLKRFMARVRRKSEKRGVLGARRHWPLPEVALHEPSGPARKAPLEGKQPSRARTPSPKVKTHRFGARRGQARAGTTPITRAVDARRWHHLPPALQRTERGSRRATEMACRRRNRRDLDVPCPTINHYRIGARPCSTRRSSHLACLQLMSVLVPTKASYRSLCAPPTRGRTAPVGRKRAAVGLKRTLFWLGVLCGGHG
jgi:hypothetical protein